MTIRSKTCGPECLTELRRRTAEERKAAVADDRADRVARGVALGERRRERGLSIERLAALTGLSAAHVSRVERGLNVPSTEALERIAAALAADPGASNEPRPWARQGSKAGVPTHGGSAAS